MRGYCRKLCTFIYMLAAGLGSLHSMYAYHYKSAGITANRQSAAGTIGTTGRSWQHSLLSEPGGQVSIDTRLMSYNKKVVDSLI